MMEMGLPPKRGCPKDHGLLKIIMFRDSRGPPFSDIPKLLIACY